jgi:hypothetical protein
MTLTRPLVRPLVRPISRSILGNGSLKTLTPPAAFSGSQSFAVTGIGSDFNSNVDFSEPTWGTAYYVSPDGSDSNDGLTWENRLQTITAAFAKAGDIRIYATGDFHWLEFIPANGRMASVASGKQVAIIPYSGGSLRAINGPKMTEKTYTDQGSGRYTVAVTDATVFGCLDYTNLDEFGNPTPLVARSSGTEVATLGGWYQVANTLNVKNSLGSDPTENIQILHEEVSGQTPPWNLYNTSFYCKDLTLLGWGIYSSASNAAKTFETKLFCVKSLHSVDEGFKQGNTSGATHNAYLKNCVVGYPNADGIDWGNETEGLEEKCISYFSGFIAGVDTPSQCSTSHQTSAVIRLGGTYQQSAADTITESGSHSWNIGCKVQNSRGTVGLKDIDFLATGSTSRVWCYKCDMSGSSSTDSLQSANSAIIYNDGSLYSGNDDSVSYTQE